MSRTAFRKFALLLAVVAPFAGAAQAAAVRDGCDRACLEGLVNNYLEALQARDPSRLALAGNHRFTENSVTLALGDGFWQTVDPGSFKPSKLYVADPATGQAIFFGGATENGHGVLFSMRLKHSKRQLTEIETLVVRRSPAIFGAWDDLPVPHPLWAQPLAPSERVSRERLVYAANQYFEGIEQGNGNIIPIEDGAVRVENAIQTAPRAERPMKIRDSMNAGTADYITEITHRRFVVDEERGIAVGLVMFQHPGNVKTANWDTARTNPNSLIVYPNTTHIFEAFKVRNGDIAHIFAHIVLQQYRQDPGWPTPPHPAWPAP